MLSPKTYKRVRNKFPKKRNNYRKYSSATWNWVDIFNEIDVMRLNNSGSYIKSVAEKYNIKRDTLKKNIING